jgi:hypothetical protein
MQELIKHKDELMKQPEIFYETLQALKKAADEEGKKKYLRDWEPNSQYTDKQKEMIDKHMANGYSHREAERMAGAHKTPSDFQSALKSGIAPSIMSDKMMSQLKPLAKMWLEEADKQEKLRADPEKNTVKRAAGQLAAAHEKHTANYAKDYDKYINSDEVKNLKGRERHAAITKWKADWKAANPQHDESLANVSQAHKQFAYNQSQAREETANKLKDMSSGASMPADMTEQEAMQHLGGGKSEEGTYAGSIVQDPSASFAQRNPQIFNALKPEQQERMNRVDSAAATQGKVRVRKAPQGGQ